MTRIVLAEVNYARPAAGLPLALDLRVRVTWLLAMMRLTSKYIGAGLGSTFVVVAI